MTHRIACVFAHPDDETFCTGALISRYAAAGIETDLFCATNGDAGRNSGVPISSRDELAQLRRNETYSAARILGIAELEMPGYGDGTLHQLDPVELIADIVAFLRRTRPTVVITFGPEGAPTGHRDHRAISRAATAAYFLASLHTEYTDQLEHGLVPHRASRLFYHAWQYPSPDPSLTLASVEPTVRIDARAWNERKLAAFMAHVTQRDHYERFVSSVLLEHEYLALASGVPQPAPMIDDVFAGL
ncbi:MAG TPA: PIG-L family deacetylase [Gemmatimonadaceae bacterium]|nr:PIG-L family deacetylase [Gemmatimonadaceae bacterium]